MIVDMTHSTDQLARHFYQTLLGSHEHLKFPTEYGRSVESHYGTH